MLNTEEWTRSDAVTDFCEHVNETWMNRGECFQALELIRWLGTICLDRHVTGFGICIKYTFRSSFCTPASSCLVRMSLKTPLSAKWIHVSTSDRRFREKISKHSCAVLSFKSYTKLSSLQLIFAPRGPHKESRSSVVKMPKNRGVK